MRMDKSGPSQRCTGFMDWLVRHPAGLLTFVFAFPYYLATTNGL